MPSSKSLWDNLSRKLTCKKCKKLFIGPKVLPCLHLICVECLRQELDSSGNSSGKKFQCHDCRETVSVLSEVEDLIADVSVVRLVEMVSKDAKLICVQGPWIFFIAKLVEKFVLLIQHLGLMVITIYNKK